MRALTKALGLAVSLVATGAVMLPLAANATTATIYDGPSGFIYGTDSWPMSVTGSGPYHEPVTASSYGGYIGMAGNWEGVVGGCAKYYFRAWSSANSAQADTNYTKYNLGIGTGVYWFMGGPGVDPDYNGTATQAANWGAYQARKALAAMASLHVTYPVVWADIEEPGIAPALDNGWNEAYTSPCSGVAKQLHTPAAVDRAEFNAFATYITTHSKYKVGVYSSAPIWANIFGTGTAAQIPNTYEWTYLPETSHVSQAPIGWCLRGTNTCAQFFGGQTSASKYALMWQWSGGGGISNGFGDFDQIDVPRMK
jgi:hypothetical protein